ncbi:hypothetical protein NM208_g6494 [Fusarium decemcellulare]|uniref:Uncharacterized protein n=1 Tax=Fusarium decemcellulare TaxID=57161 RepID=A0ACC1SCT9_9HYPO|nr:hypothetical protein NM208_g6494 [Fusarium decemcellulare]
MKLFAIIISLTAAAQVGVAVDIGTCDTRVPTTCWRNGVQYPCPVTGGEICRSGCILDGNVVANIPGEEEKGF